jgi:hypothetical protein
MTILTERYSQQIAGKIECLDRVLITGTLPTICYAKGMTAFLFNKGIRIFDYTQFAQPLRQRIHDQAQAQAQKAGLEIEFVRKKNFRKEDRLKAILDKRGHHPGLVHIFSAMEPCTAYKPWHDKKTQRTFLKPDSGKCLHYYFYFIDQQFGLCYLRVPTWCPFRLQFYFNGHNWLGRQLDRRGIGYELLDNAFLQIDDWPAAQKLADNFDARILHRTLDRYAAQYCPVNKDFGQYYHWSLMQAEYASDIVFQRAADLQPLYEAITRTAIHAVKPDQVATFLGCKLNGNFQGELGNHYHTRIEGTRIKHHMAGKAALKIYDKFGRVLRIETMVNDVSFFKHYREVEHRDGSSSMKQAPLRKTIYSLPILVELCRASNRRYLEFVSQIDDPAVGFEGVRKLAEPARQKERSFRGFNLFCKEDHQLFVGIARGEFNISGLSNRDLRRVLGNKAGSQVSRLLKRLRLHGLIKKIGRTYKYYLTKLGRKVVLTALKLRELVVIPALAELRTT